MVLPYDDGRLAFVAILPDSPDLRGWLDSLDGNVLSQLVQGAEEQRFFRLAFPKFEAEWSGSLQEMLTDMGLEGRFHTRPGRFFPDGRPFQRLLPERSPPRRQAPGEREGH